MPQAHRGTDLRICGATTIVEGQTTVFVNGLLWAVDGDPNTDGGGGLTPSGTTVFVEGLRVIVHAPDNAQEDDLCPLAVVHCNPHTAQGSPDVYAYG